VQLQMFEGVYITHHHAVDHHAGRLDDALYVTLLANADRAFLGIDITDHPTFDLHRATEAQITAQLGVVRNECGLARRTIDARLLALIHLEHQDLTPRSEEHTSELQ